MKQPWKLNYVEYLRLNGIENAQGEQSQWIDRNMKGWKEKHERV